MKEVIAIHVGQGGIQVGNACWELFCLEHSISPSGTFPDPNNIPNNNDAFHAFFSESGSGQYVPRAIHIDLEPTVIDEIRTGAYRQLYHPENLISGKEDAASNFSRGMYTVGKEKIDLCLDRIRKEADKCADFQGFLIFSALGGGTGSGLGSLLQERLSVDYDKKTKIGFNIFPSPQLSNVCVEPYNSVLATQRLIENLDFSVVLANEALQGICKRNLDIQRPTNTNFNHIIAQLVSSLTASFRFDGAFHTGLKELQENLVPYPHVNLMLSSYSPIVNEEKAYFRNLSLNQLTEELFEPANMMTKCDHRHGKFLACTLNYRGNIAPRDVGAAICNIKPKKTIRFVDWSPSGFKCGINYYPSVAVPGSIMASLSRSCCMIGNSTAISNVLARINHKFDLMYAERAYVDFYLREGMEEGEFSEARECLAALEADYKQIEVEFEAQEQTY